MFLALLGAEMLRGPAHLEAVLQPQAFGLVGHVRELGTDRAAIDLLELREDFAQLEPRLDHLVATARQELGVEVRLGQAEVLEP